MSIYHSDDELAYVRAELAEKERQLLEAQNIRLTTLEKAQLEHSRKLETMLCKKDAQLQEIQHEQSMREKATLSNTKFYEKKIHEQAKRIEELELKLKEKEGFDNDDAT